MTQYFYIDESGEPGLCSLKSSPYFLLAMIQLPNREPIPEVVALRKALRVAPDFEFHFHQMAASQKDRFFQVISAIPLRVRAAILFKTDYPPVFHGMSGTGVMIKLITRLALRASPLDLANDILILDGATESLRKTLRIRLSQACKEPTRVRPFKKIVSSDSNLEDGLQLADMIAGAVREYAWKNNPVYYESFCDQVVDLWLVA